MGSASQLGAYRLVQERDDQVWEVISSLPVPDDLVSHYLGTRHALPMVVEPGSPGEDRLGNQYRTEHTGLMLGRHTAHGSYQAIDAIETQDSVRWALHHELLEHPEHGIQHYVVDEHDTTDVRVQKSLQHQQFVAERREIEQTFASQIGYGGKLFLTNRFDSRGRMYARGYHVNPQGAPFQKAALQFHRREVLTGLEPDSTRTSTGDNA